MVDINGKDAKHLLWIGGSGVVIVTLLITLMGFGYFNLHAYAQEGDAGVEHHIETQLQLMEKLNSERHEEIVRRLEQISRKIGN